MFFSIIVPVYKVEQYLDKCIASVLNQSFTDYEVILVDDGSPDHCPQLCDEYSLRDERVRVIHKKNGGASSARNAGLLEAKGKYISFLDADDFWLHKQALESIHNLIVTTNSEIVVLKAVNYFQSTDSFSDTYNSFSSIQLQGIDYEGKLLKLISASAYRANAWNKVFSRELMSRGNLFFTEGIIAEDVDWAARLCLYANSIDILDKPIYAYRAGRPGAVTSSMTIKNLIDSKIGIKQCLEFVADKTMSDRFSFAYYSYVAYRYVIWLAEYYIVKDPTKKALRKEMNDFAWLLSYDGIRRVRIARYLYRFLGFYGTSLVLGMYLERRRVRKERHGNPDHLYTDI